MNKKIIKDHYTVETRLALLEHEIDFIKKTLIRIEERINDLKYNLKK